MEFKAKRSELQRYLGAVVGVIEKRNTIPIVQNVILKGEGDNGLRIDATDLEIWMTGMMSAEISGAGEIVLPGRKLFEIVRNGPAEEIIFRSEGGDRVAILCGMSRYRLYSPSPENFPERRQFGPGKFRVQAGQFHSMLKWAGISMTAEESRYQLNGVRLETEDSLLKLVSTDGHRLSVAELKMPGEFSGGKGSVLVPRKTVGEVAKMAAEAKNEEIRYDWDSTGIWFETESRRLWSPLLQGGFPEYKRIIPGSGLKKIVVSREVFIGALRRVGVITDEESRSVIMTISNGQIKLTAAATETGEVEESFSAEFNDIDSVIRLNWKYALDFLEQIPESEIEFSIKNGDSPVMIRGDSKSESKAFAVIMPMRA